MLVFRHSCAGGNPSFAEERQRRLFATEPGVARQLKHVGACSDLSFASPKERNPRKGDPRFVAATRSPLLLTNAGRCGTRARGCNSQMVYFCARPQTVLADIPRVCSAFGKPLHRFPVRQALMSAGTSTKPLPPLLLSWVPGLTATTAIKPRHPREGGNPSSVTSN